MKVGGASDLLKDLDKEEDDVECKLRTCWTRIEDDMDLVSAS